MLTAWIALPLVLVVLATGFGLVVESACGRPMPWPLVVLTGAAAFTGWSALAIVPALTGVVEVGAVLITLVGVLEAGRRRRPRDGGPWPILAAAVPFAVGAAPFVLSGRPTFGGYASLGDGAFQMIGADLVPRIGATADLARSTVRAVMQYRFANGYPSGAITFVGVPSRLLGAQAVETFAVAVCWWAALGGLAIAHLARASGLASRRGAAVIGVVAGCAPLFQAFVLQNSIKEVATAALVATLVATTIWAWGHLRDGGVRPGMAVGVVVAAIGCVLGPGAAVYLGPFAVLAVAALVIGLRRGTLPTRALAALAVSAATAAVVGLPSWLAAIRFVGGADAVAVLSAQTELGNLAQPLSILRAAQGWTDFDYRFAGDDLGDELWATGSAVVVLALGLLGTTLAVARRSWGWAGWLAAVAIPTVYLVVQGSPWAAAKGLAIGSVAVFALVGAGVVAAMAWRRSAGVVAGALVAGVLVVTGYYQYRGAPVGPGERTGELRSIATDVGHDPVLLTEYDEYVKPFFDRGRPMALGEDNFLGWNVRYDRGLSTPARVTPNVDRLVQRDLDPFRWILVRRSPLAGWPSSSFRLARTTRHYWLFRRVSDAVPRRWAGVERDGVATEDLRCAQLRLFRRGGRALLRPWARSWLMGQVSPSWVPQAAASYLADTPTVGAASVEVAVPRDGRYRLWLEGSFGRRVQVLVDGRPAASIAADSRNQQAQPEPAGPDSGLALRRGRHVLTFNLRRELLRPGAASVSTQIGRVWLEDASTSPRIVPVSSLSCRDGRTPRVDWLELPA